MPSEQTVPPASRRLLPGLSHAPPAAPALASTSNRSTDFVQVVARHAYRDWMLVQRVTGQGDEKACAELLMHYHGSLKRYVSRAVREPEVANDLVNEIFARAFRYLRSFRGEYVFSTWLFRVARNHCVSYFRRQTRQLQTVSLQAWGPNSDGNQHEIELPDSSPTPYELLTKAQRSSQLRQAVEKLPGAYRIAIQLFYFEELTYAEIAAALNLPLGTVKARLYQARVRLSTLLLHEREEM